MCQLVIDPTTEQVVATPVTFEGDVLIEEGTVTTEVLDDLAVTTEKIANNAVSGDKIIAGSILTKHLDASSIFAKDATIMDLIASNIKVSQLFANTGVVGDLTTSVIHSADFGNVLDISSNASITLANNYIGLMIETQDSTPTKLVLTDRMISAMADNIDVVAGGYITLRVADVLENEILSQDTAPEDPEEGLIWVDTSSLPNIVRKWNGNSWVIIDGSTLDGNSILINKLIQNMSSRISQTNDEILLQVTREDNAVIEGQVETINTQISKIEQRADQISMLVASQPTTYVQVGTPVIRANGDVWRNPNVEDYFVAEIIGDADGIEFAYDDDGNLCYRYADGVDEKYEFSIVDDDLVVGADAEDDLSYNYQYVDGKIGSWKVVKNTAFSRLDQTVEGISTVVYDSETGLSVVAQKADKITWLIESGTSSSNMELTSDALRVIADNIDLRANDSVRITSANQISATAAQNIDLSSNHTITFNAAQLSAIASNINLQSNQSVIDVATGAASSAAAGKSKVFAQSTAPSGSLFNVGDLWIDTANSNVLKVWDGDTWETKRDTSLDYLVNEVGGKTTVFYSTSQPTTQSTGDIWYDTRNGLIKRYNGSTWVDITSTALKQALDAAQDAQSTADSKVKTYSQTSAPSSSSELSVGDLWIDTDDNNKLYRWNGSSWSSIRDDHLDSTVTSLNTKITNVESEITSDAITNKVRTNQYYIDDLNGKASVSWVQNNYSTITQTDSAIVAAVGSITMGSRNLVLNSENEVSFVGETSSDIYGAVWNLSDYGKEALELIGAEFSISYMGKSTVANNYIQVFAVKYDNNGDIIVCSSSNESGSDSNPIDSMTTSYRRYTHSLKTILSGAVAVVVKVLENSNQGTISIKQIQAEIGNKSSDWNVAPEDINGQISDIRDLSIDNQSIFERVVRIETDGLHVGDNLNTSNEVVIDSESVNIVMGGNKYSAFASDYVQFGNYQLRRTADGGLAFKLKE